LCIEGFLSFLCESILETIESKERFPWGFGGATGWIIERITETLRAVRALRECLGAGRWHPAWDGDE